MLACVSMEHSKCWTVHTFTPCQAQVVSRCTYREGPEQFAPSPPDSAWGQWHQTAPTEQLQPPGTTGAFTAAFVQAAVAHPRDLLHSRLRLPAQRNPNDILLEKGRIKPTCRVGGLMPDASSSSKCGKWQQEKNCGENCTCPNAGGKTAELPTSANQRERTSQDERAAVSKRRQNLQSLRNQWCWYIQYAEWLLQCHWKPTKKAFRSSYLNFKAEAILANAPEVTVWSNVRVYIAEWNLYEIFAVWEPC